MDLQAGFGCGSGDQVDDDLQAGQRMAAPVLSDLAEQAVLDLVPFASVVSHSDGILLSADRARATLVRMSSAFLVETKVFG